MRLKILSVALVIPIALYAQPRLEMTRAYLCQKGEGPRFLIKPEELKTILDSNCRSIEYRTQIASSVKRCTSNDGTVTYTSHDPFPTGRGCRDVDEPPR